MKPAHLQSGPQPPLGDAPLHTVSRARERVRTHVFLAIPVENAPAPGYGERLARRAFHAFEVVLAAVGLVVLSPLLLIEAIVIKLDSPGPVFYAGLRAGRSVPTPGRELAARDDVRPPEGEFEPDRLYWAPTWFSFVKFRTMWQDAAERFPEYYWWYYELDPEEFEKMYYKLDDDPRLTRVGRFLRKTTLDELPNLWNVLRGEVRLVGPRPEAREAQSNYPPRQMEKFTVEPGITCLSKIAGRGKLSVGEQIELDLEYVRTRSLWLDVKILAKTVWLVLIQRGAF